MKAFLSWFIGLLIVLLIALQTLISGCGTGIVPTQATQTAKVASPSDPWPNCCADCKSACWDYYNGDRQWIECAEFCCSGCPPIEETRIAPRSPKVQRWNGPIIEVPRP